MSSRPSTDVPSAMRPLRLLPRRATTAPRLRIAVLAPPWLPVPPAGYGGIEAARLADKALVLAGPVQAGQEQHFRDQIEPHIDGRRVRYVGEVAGAAKQQLYANAQALLMPVRWREPFGMVMVEALACGTPVIPFPEGAAAEIVIDGENGMLVSDEHEMARAIDQVGAMGAMGAIGPARCRASVAERYDIAVTATDYERVYRHVAGVERAPAALAPQIQSTGDFQPPQLSARR